MKWTEDELKLALALYCQIPFGKMHSRNQDVIRLAGNIGRTPSAVAMKLVNLASLDLAIINSGRSGLGNASAMDRRVPDESDRREFGGHRIRGTPSPNSRDTILNSRISICNPLGSL